MSGAQLRALTALAVVFLASVSALAQDAQSNSTVVKTPPTSIPVATPTPASNSTQIPPAAAPSTPVNAAAPVAAAPSTPVDAAAPVAAAPAPAPAAPAAEPPSAPSSAGSPVTTPPSEGNQTHVGSSPPPEDPCKKIPGCAACTNATTTPSRSRKLMQNPMGGGFMSGITAANPNLDWASLVKSPYDEPDHPFCTNCTGDGYIQGTEGKCICAAGFGDTYPTGHCDKCPDGYISRGGFRAVCEECTDVAWSNEERTLCICASGWYGYTNTASRQATCNQCPGTRPVSKDGSRSAAECMACPVGQKPNEIYSECVDAIPAPPPPPQTLADMIAGNQPPSPPPAPPAPLLYNSSTFADAKKDWVINTRATENKTNPFTDLIGNVVESMIMGRNVSDTAQTPGDLIYQMLSKPPPSAQDALKNLQNVAAIGASIGAAAGALPAVAKALGTDTPLGGLVNTAAQGLSGLASNMRQAAPGVPATPAPGSGPNMEMITNLLGQVGKVLNKPAADSTASTPANPLEGLQQLQGQLKAASSLMKLANAFKPATPAPAAALVTPVSTAASNMAKFVNVAKTADGFVKVPSAPAKVASAVNPLKLLTASGSKAK